MPGFAMILIAMLHGQMVHEHLFVANADMCKTARADLEGDLRAAGAEIVSSRCVLVTLARS